MKEQSNTRMGEDNNERTKESTTEPKKEISKEPKNRRTNQITYMGVDCRAGITCVNVNVMLM